MKGRNIGAATGLPASSTAKLWARTRNGHYLPNPALQLRQGEGWQPVYEALKLDWVDRGTGADRAFSNRPALAVALMTERLAGKVEEIF